MEIMYNYTNYWKNKLVKVGKVRKYFPVCWFVNKSKNALRYVTHITFSKIPRFYLYCLPIDANIAKHYISLIEQFSVKMLKYTCALTLDLSVHNVLCKVDITRVTKYPKVL